MWLISVTSVHAQIVLVVLDIDNRVYTSAVGGMTGVELQEEEQMDSQCSIQRHQYL